MLKYIAGALAGLILSVVAIAYAQPGANSGNWGVIEPTVSGDGGILFPIVCPDGTNCLERPTGGADAAIILETTPDRISFNAGSTLVFRIDAAGIDFVAGADLNVASGQVVGNGGLGTQLDLNTDTYAKIINNGGSATMELLVPQTSDPCGTAIAGALFYNATSNYFCFCNGAGADIKMNDNSTACF